METIPVVTGLTLAGHGLLGSHMEIAVPRTIMEQLYKEASLSNMRSTIRIYSCITLGDDIQNPSQALTGSKCANHTGYQSTVQGSSKKEILVHLGSYSYKDKKQHNSTMFFSLMFV